MRAKEPRSKKKKIAPRTQKKIAALARLPPIREIFSREEGEARKAGSAWATLLADSTAEISSATGGVAIGLHLVSAPQPLQLYEAP